MNIYQVAHLEGFDPKPQVLTNSGFGFIPVATEMDR